MLHPFSFSAQVRRNAYLACRMEVGPAECWAWCDAASPPQSFVVLGTHWCPSALLNYNQSDHITCLSQSWAGQWAKLVFLVYYVLNVLASPIEQQAWMGEVLSANVCSFFFCLTVAWWWLKFSEIHSRGCSRPVAVAHLHINVVVCMFDHGRIFNVS